jgi:hypothetical protein
VDAAVRFIHRARESEFARNAFRGENHANSLVECLNIVMTKTRHRRAVEGGGKCFQWDDKRHNDWEHFFAGIGIQWKRTNQIGDLFQIGPSNTHLPPFKVVGYWFAPLTCFPARIDTILAAKEVAVISGYPYLLAEHPISDTKMTIKLSAVYEDLSVRKRYFIDAGYKITIGMPRHAQDIQSTRLKKAFLSAFFSQTLPETA